MIDRKGKIGLISHMGLIGLIGLMAIIGMTGCSRSRPATFYLLTASAELAEPAALTSPTARAIGVGPIDFPSYLDRTQMVTRKEDNTLILSEYHRWGEPLGSNFHIVLTQNLSRALPGIRVVIYPGVRAADLKYRVQMNVTRFDAGPDKNAHLEANWDVYPAGSSEPILSRKSSLTLPCEPNNYAKLPITFSKLVADLSLEIAKGLAELP